MLIGPSLPDAASLKAAGEHHPELHQQAIHVPSLPGPSSGFLSFVVLADAGFNLLEETWYAQCISRLQACIQQFLHLHGY